MCKSKDVVPLVVHDPESNASMPSRATIIQIISYTTSSSVGIETKSERLNTGFGKDPDCAPADLNQVGLAVTVVIAHASK